LLIRIRAIHKKKMMFYFFEKARMGYRFRFRNGLEMAGTAARMRFPAMTREMQA